LSGIIQLLIWNTECRMQKIPSKRRPVKKEKA